jgi:polyisoprenoid-binding protein YceI
MKSRHLFAFVGATFALFLAPAADAKLGGASGAAVTFTAIGPGGMKIVGQGSTIAVSEDGQDVVVKVGLTDLSTGIALRDKHMKEKYLLVGTYPNAELRVPRGQLKFAEGAAQAKGLVTIHGQAKKDADFSYTAKKSGDGWDVNGTVRVSLKDHGIEVPNYLGVSVKPDVDVAVHFVVKDN